MQKGTHNAHKCNFCGLTDKTHANSTVQPSYLLPVKLTPLVKFLVSYPPGLVTYITSSFSMDFSLHFQGCRSFLIPNNLTSALENICRQKTGTGIGCRLDGGSGLISKKIPGNFRLIHHFSFSKGTSRVL